jgi:hypothetical protein
MPPSNESVPLKVTLTIEVDGHVLHFADSGRAWGPRLYGEDPEQQGLPRGCSLEDSICITADTCLTEVSRRAENLLSQMYPVTNPDDKVTSALPVEKP